MIIILTVFNVFYLLYGQYFRFVFFFGQLNIWEKEHRIKLISRGTKMLFECVLLRLMWNRQIKIRGLANNNQQQTQIHD